MEILPKDIKFDFIGAGKIFVPISLITIFASLYIWFQTGSNKYGTDFIGGHEIVVELKDRVTSADLRKALEAEGLKDFNVQSFELDSSEYSIRLPANVGDQKTIREQISATLNKHFAGKFEIIKTDFVGPTIGKELRNKAMIAIVLGLVAILVYISIRFELAFAVGAVAALFHDVIVCTGVYLLSGKTLSMASLAAALTIVGYSVNDTIVVFDRVREEMNKQKKLTLREVFNYSVAATLSRTIITSLLTFFSALALYLFGGGAISDLSLFLVVGIIAGSYSTIFIASPIALAWEYLCRPNVEKHVSRSASF